MSGYKTIYFIFFNIVVILLSGLISEICVRVFNPDIKPQGTDKNLIADSLYYHSAGLKPFSRGKSNGAVVEVDRYGFRKYKTEVDANKKSWLLLGDSVTMGIGVEADSTYAGIFNEAIDSVNVLNPSLIGYNVEDYYTVFKYFVIRNEYHFRYERVTLFWCLNDVYSNVEDRDVPGGRLRSVIPDILHYLRINSRLYFYLKTILFDRSKSYYLFDYAYYNTENVEFRRSINRIAAIGKMCDDRKIKFEIFLLPYEYQLRPEYLTETSPQSVMMTALGSHPVKTVNLTAPFRSVTHPKAMFLYGDGIHYSKAGHKLIAESLLN